MCLFLKKNGPPYALKKSELEMNLPFQKVFSPTVSWKKGPMEMRDLCELWVHVLCSQTIGIVTVACQSFSIPDKIAWINEVFLTVWLCSVTKSIIFIYSLTYPPAIATLFSSCPTDQFSVKWERIDWCPNFFFSFPLPNLFWVSTVGFIKNTFLRITSLSVYSIPDSH